MAKPVSSGRDSMSDKAQYLVERLFFTGRPGLMVCSFSHLQAGPTNHPCSGESGKRAAQKGCDFKHRMAEYCKITRKRVCSHGAIALQIL